MKKIISTIFISLLIGSCSTTKTSQDEVLAVKPDKTMLQQEKWDTMVGNWYGNQPAKQGGIRQQTMERYVDGTYKLTVRHVLDGEEISKNIEVGYWGVVGPVYFSIFKGWVENNILEPSDPSNPNNYDAYRIMELTIDKFKYQSYTTNSIYTLQKVPKEFVFPNN